MRREGSRTTLAPAPQKPNYGFRRVLALLLVIVALAAVVWAVLWIVGWFAGMLRDDPESDATSDPEATEIFTGQPAACEPDALSWTLDVDSGAAGRTVRFDWGVTNHGDLPCTIDAAPTNLSFAVTSGDDEVWNSAHCGASEPFLLLLGPGDSTERAQFWEGQRSQAGCEAVSGGVQPGYYQVDMAHAGAEVAGGSEGFELTAAVESKSAPEGEEAPAEGEAPPADGEEAPAEGEEEPAPGESAPPEGDEAPAEGEESPADGEDG